MLRTWSATEQPDATMDSPGSMALLQGNPWSAPLSSCEIHVDFNNGMWWAMPHDLSHAILNEWSNGAHQVSFVWDWQATRQGSYQSNGDYTSTSRYMIDFDTMYQRNLDNNRNRKVQVVCVDLQEAQGLLQSNPTCSLRWEIHVEFNNSKWWAMPHDLSHAILNEWSNGAHQVAFVWDWQATRQGSYQSHGDYTSTSRYMLDFDTMHQPNQDNNRIRKVKVVLVASHCGAME